ncbi:MAG TPA: hypothetical protein PKX33_00730 [Candidatus Paceibacterota bacterium]|nr:hypothetical protein [Candidatus Paceibacterota bacterium]
MFLSHIILLVCLKVNLGVINITPPHYKDYCPKKRGYFSALKFLCSDRRPPQCFLKQQSFPRGHVGVVFNQCVVFSFLIIYFAGSSNGRTHPSGGCYRGELGEGTQAQDRRTTVRGGVAQIFSRKLCVTESLTKNKIIGKVYIIKIKLLV